MASKYPPGRESLLVPWGLNWKTKILATPSEFSLTAPQAEANGDLYDDFLVKWNICQDPSTKTKEAVEIKDVAKDLFVKDTRILARITQNSPTTTNAMRIDLGLPERDLIPTPAEPIIVAPALTVVSVFGRNVRIRVRDASGDVRGRLPQADGAIVYSFVGASPPEGAVGWKCEGAITKDSVIVVLDVSVAVGAKVFLTAQWFNTRGAGPGCTPVAAVIGAEGALAA